MPEFSFTVTGLDQLRSSMQGFSRQLNTQLKPAVKDTALEVRERARNKARAFSTDGFYPAGIFHTIEPGGLSATITTRAPTSASIERGRQPGEIVRFGLILKWVQRRGIVRGLSISTHRATRLSKNGRDNVKPQEYAAAREVIAQIKAHGTMPHPHLIPAAIESEDGWSSRVRASVRQAVSTVRSA